MLELNTIIKIEDTILNVDNFTLDELLDFNKVSEDLFNFIESNKSDTDINTLQKFICLCLSELLSKVYYRLKISGEEYEANVCNELKSLTSEDVEYFDELKLNYDRYINKLSNLNYTEQVKHVLDANNYCVQSDWVTVSESVSILAKDVVAYKLRCLSKLFNEVCNVIKPMKIDPRDVRYVQLSSKVVFVEELVDNIKIYEFLKNNFTIKSKVCKKIGVSDEVIKEFFDCIIVMVKDDAECPHEIWNKFYTTFCKIPDLISKTSFSYKWKAFIGGYYNFSKQDNNFMFTECIELYNNYKKSGCYIEVVE